jgi:hypothetical protein
MNLFSATPAQGGHRANETIYGFLSRADGAYWARVRALLESWFAELAPADQADLKARFERGDPEQVVSAFWELYIHEGFRRSSFSLTPHPDLPETSKHPDFLVEGHGLSFYLECIVAGDPEEMISSDRRRRQIYESVSKLENDEFFLNLRIQREGDSSPSGATLRRRVDLWLATLDRAELRRRLEEGSAMPEKRFPIGDWTFSVRPLPKSDELAGQPSRSPIGIFPGRAGFSEARERIADALEMKARRYGRLDHPYLIAVLSTATFAADDEDFLGALFGGWTLVLHETGDAQDPRAESTRADNGVWSATRNRRVSGVISARRLAPWSVSTEWPRLWLNPWAERPLKLALSWLARTSISDEGKIQLAPPILSPEAFFELPPGWPGPEEPLE